MKNFTKKTEIELEKKNLNVVTVQWKRNCPKCNKELIYKNKRRYKNAVKMDKKCQSCVQTGVVRKIKITYKKNCSDCNVEIIYSCKSSYKIGIKRNSKCSNCSANSRVIKWGWNKSNIRLCPQCKSILNYSNVGHCTQAEKKKQVCRKCSNELRKQNILENLKGKHTWANYNPKSCEYFNNLNIKNKWNLQHALNGGEVKILNYFVDAYDKEKNIVVEYDESYHYTKQGNLKQKDVLRQQRIMTHLGCKFFRYNERTKELYEVTLI